MGAVAELESDLQREIFAQPEVLARFHAREGARTIDLGAQLGARRPAGVLIAARGSSDHAAVYAKYAFGARLGVPIALAAPSLITLYERAPRFDRWIALGISQSGASPDVVRVIAEAREQGSATVAITDRADSALARVAEHVVPLGIGGERAIAATGSFTTTLFALAHLVSGWNGEEDPALEGVPELALHALGVEAAARGLAEAAARHPACAVVGRGFGFPVALEWALKLKELAGVFAEPFSAADYRHGPIALATNGAPVFAIELRGPAAPDVRRLATELRQRGARIVRVSDETDADLCIPNAPEWLAPIPAAIVGQLVSFWLARARGRDPDRPPGLAKVTRTF
ncbi:MAG TPA: SIS domain-containing protein [Myxococcota bacterium]|nr:SIS domain-containing protein [Myxococcota bacterium]